MLRAAAFLSLSLCFAALAAAADTKEVAPVLKFKMQSLAGKPVELSQYQGKVVLIVNVASECGYTDQYKGLQALHDKYAKDGLVVLGVPCNQFGGQEPGTAADIAKFCESKYKVKFDMLDKVEVKGDGACPLYKHLTGKETNAKFAGPIKWNFEKFLVAKDGTVVGRFGSDVEPESEKLAGAIQGELKK